MTIENIINDAEALDNYVPQSKAEEHFIKAIKLIRSEFFQSATIEFHQACKLDATLVVPLTKKLYTNSIQYSDYAAALSAGLLLYSVDNTNYKLAIELAGLSRNLSHNKQAASLYKKALEIQPNSITALCSLAALTENVPYQGEEAVNAYKYFTNIQYIFPDFLIMDEEGELDFDPNYLKNISNKVSNYITNVVADENQKKEELIKDFGLNDKIGQEASDILYKKRTITPSKLKTSDYKLYLESLTKNGENNQDIALYNLILMMIIKNINLDQLGDKLNNLKNNLKTYKKTLPFVGIIEGIYHSQTGKSALAQQVFVEILKTQKFDRYANANLGLIFRAKKEVFKAARYLIFAYYLFDKAQRNFNIEKIIKNARSRYRARSFREASEIFLLIIQEKYAEPKDYSSCADCLDKTSNTNKAIEIVKECIQRFPEEEESKLLVDKFYRLLIERADKIATEAGQERRAFLMYQKAYSLDQRLECVHKMLAVMEKFPLIPSEIEFRSGILERFRSKLDERSNESNQEAQSRNEALEIRWANYIIKAKTLVRNKNYNSALQLVESAFRIKTNKETFILLCNLYKILGKKQELVNLIKKHQPDNPKLKE